MDDLVDPPIPPYSGSTLRLAPTTPFVCVLALANPSRRNPAGGKTWGKKERRQSSQASYDDDEGDVSLPTLGQLAVLRLSEFSSPRAGG